MAPIPLILDVDTGVDDALALLYAVASPEVDLIGATTVMGNVGVERATTNTLALLELAGRPDVEVARGASRPLVGDHEPSVAKHGITGVGRARLPEPSAAASERSAAQLIVDRARARPGEVLLVATGPLTNVAMAMALEPDLPELLRGLTIGGGAYATPVAETNMRADPDAAQAVFEAFVGAPTLPVCVGLDVTDRVRITRRDLDELRGAARSDAVAVFVDDALSHYLEHHDREGPAGGPLRDPTALAIAIDEGLAELVAMRVSVDHEGDRAGRMTATDPGGDMGRANARVAVRVDAGTVRTRFLTRLRSVATTPRPPR